MPKRVLVIGSSGMAGHLIALTLKSVPDIQVIDIGPRKKVFDSTLLVNLRDIAAVEDILVTYNPDFVVNCVGILIQASARNRLDAIWYNAYFPNMLSSLCEKGARKLIHLSTDCVFSGKNGPYKENAFRDGDSFYDRTKALGEVASGRDLTIRTSITGPEMRPEGSGLFNWFMLQNSRINGYTKALWSGVMTSQLARFLVYVITEKPELVGLIHYSTPGGISKYDLLRLFAETFGREIEIIPIDEPVIDKRLVDTRKDFHCTAPAYKQQIEDMKLWVDEHHHLYPHYSTSSR